MLQKLAEIDKNALIGICEISRKFIKICGGGGGLKVQKQETCPGSAEIGSQLTFGTTNNSWTVIDIATS